MKKLLNICGAIILTMLVAVILPLLIPKLMGIMPYDLISGSMEPEIPANSVIYVKSCDTSKLEPGDIITFKLGTGTELSETHRIVEVDKENALFTTKGDANRSVDQTKVKAENVMGKVVFHIPKYGKIARLLNTSEGIAACIAVFAAILIMWIAADRIKPKERTP